MTRPFDLDRKGVTLAADAAPGLRPFGAEPPEASQAEPLVPSAGDDTPQRKLTLFKEFRGPYVVGDVSDPDRPMQVVATFTGKRAAERFMERHAQ